ncbi:hypothetical protein [Cohnella phaseoli]|uniref:E2/UBC family protein D n=1 Tax=Cohnella phaseoli TaxID=456490 RepID=A0A3D9JQ77_9BACL|nr:hypothetical protein [Cohnella phaseoli]RED75949.1 E2/UBC family protein D [Cohnella phaseoli]
MNEKRTRLILDESGRTFPIVERELNGNIINKYSVNPADLMRLMIKNADDWMIFEAFTARSEGPYNIFDSLFSFLDEQSDKNYGEIWFNELLKHMRDSAYSHTKRTYAYDFSELLRVMCKNLTNTELDSDAYRRLFQGILAKAENVLDPEAVAKLAKYLLESVQFFDSPNIGLVQSILDTIFKYVRSHESINEMWTFLAERVSQESVMNYALAHLDELVINTPILPSNCIFYSKRRQEEIIAIRVHKQMIDVNLIGTEYPSVGHPALIYVFKLKKEKPSIEAFLFAVKDTVITEKTLLYRYPYSNVYGNGKCCWSTFPNIDKVRQLESFPDIFMNGERNFHLYPKTGDMDYRAILTLMSGREFEDQLLVSLDVNIGELLKIED